jgi:(E)-4-hydroxy-3-methylbut-2-enyl-diphosphate synthase
MGRVSKTVKIGGFSHIHPVLIGGGHPVVVQTMWKDRLSFSDLNENLVKRIDTLADMGCGLLRFAVPDMEAAETLGRLAQMTSMPLVADIHFDHKIALRCLDFPIAKIRINPGNIGSKEKTREVLEKAASGKIPIRIGINSGSLPKDLQKRVEEGMDTAAALVQAALRELEIFEEFGFNDVLVSMKASGIADNIKANRLFAQESAVPLHLGLTEAGPLVSGAVKSTAALLTLLQEGIGDTIRVSLSHTMESEIIAAREILKASAQQAAAQQAGVNIVSCPRCGRHAFDTHGFCERWLPRLYALKKDITVAIMGCEVNGPTEAKHAALGITGAGDKVLIFKHGVIIKTIDAIEADKVFEEELGKL